MTALALVADVEAVSRAVPSTDTARVQRLIEMVSAGVVGYTGQLIAEASSTITVYPHDGEVRLPQRPVTAVASVTSQGELLPATAYAWSANGYLTRAPLAADWVLPGDAWLTGTAWPATPLVVAYTHGYPAGSIPDDIAMVVADVVAARWLSGDQRAEGLVSESIDGYAQAWAASSSSGGGGWLPEHRAVLDRYRRSGLASVRLG
jgi:hypothetical protein